MATYKAKDKVKEVDVKASDVAVLNRKEKKKDMSIQFPSFKRSLISSLEFIGFAFVFGTLCYSFNYLVTKLFTVIL